MSDEEAPGPGQDAELARVFEQHRRHLRAIGPAHLAGGLQPRGRDPAGVAEALNRAEVESRAGCHCATLAHHVLGLTPPASCRLSFYLSNMQALV